MNSIELASKFLPIIDETYKAAAVTQGMDSGTRVDFTAANEVKVLKISTTGLGDYSREDGYPKGDVATSWETITLSEERGKEFSVDRMDNEEALGQAFGATVGMFQRNHVAPELDAYRFAKYAGTSGISKATAAVLDKTTILDAIDEAYRKQTADEVPEAGRRLYINSDLQPALAQAISRQWGSDAAVSNKLASYNDMPINYVSPSRFYTGITLNDGTTSWGYARNKSAHPFTGDGTAKTFTVTEKPLADAIISVTVAGTPTAYTYVASTGVVTLATAPANGAAVVVNYYTAANINFLMIDPAALLQVVKFSLPKIFDPDTNQDKDAWKFQFRLYHDAHVYEEKVAGVYLSAKPGAASHLD